jgi:hypothetical protein
MEKFKTLFIFLFVIAVVMATTMPASARQRYFPKIFNGAGQWTGLAIVNNGTANATLTFKAYSDVGALLGTAQRILEPHNQLAQVFGQLFPGLDDTVGLVVIESDTAKVEDFFLLFDTAVNWMDGAVASTKGLKSFVKDLHGAGAVRFDTKVAGSPGGERYYNYIRLVRDAK